ncbi:MAG TPA: 3D-(3,5/4)-trihydroxycyclohexane-1,2-dione acylhydrolase (decyclizing) [Bauldia sp.]|nr:3D-(3,5/4)-trihydroxycyclohexane-1,2-dione acylhydrolase (decyclizing) [Bauldia sp.]
MSTGSENYVGLTTAQALVKYLTAQQIAVDGGAQPLFGGAFAIFGHGNVICLGEALYEARGQLPTWRGQNEQSMGLAAVAYAKAHLRRRICIATSSIGPGATNMITAAGVAHTNRLPVLFLAGDTYHHRLPNPVLQQVEHFGDPTISVNDAFKPVVRYWDRITHPAQLIQSLPAAVATMLDPADCGPAFLGLPQDVQGVSYDFPARFFEPRVHRIRRLHPDTDEVIAAADLIRRAKRPVIVSGGGVHYALATRQLAEFAASRGIPVVETIAGMSALDDRHPGNCGPLGSTGADSANTVAGEADLVLAIGTRLQDFTTASWTVFAKDAPIVALNAARFDAAKHFAAPVVADAREGLAALAAALGEWKADAQWTRRARELRDGWHARVNQRTAPTNSTPTYAQVVGVVNRRTTAGDRVVTAAGGLPAELSMNWRSTSGTAVDVEFGFSCMGYEIAGGLGSRIAQMERSDAGDTIVLVGDGSYLILNSEIYSSVLAGRKLIVIVCDNGGFAVIDKLQRNTGNASFNNLIADSSPLTEPFSVDFATHAAAMGARSETVGTIAELEMAFDRARQSDRTYVIEIKVDPNGWTDESKAWWEVGTPEVSKRPQILAAAARIGEGRERQRRGV